MNEKGMIEYKESFITRIVKFFKRRFGRNEIESAYAQKEPINEIAEEKDEKNKDFINSIKVDVETVNPTIEKEMFLEKIKGNEELLNMLSIDRLKRLEKYYDEVIAENDEKIRKLKAEV